MKDWVALDIETTGLDFLRHGVCEVGIVSSTGAGFIEFFLPIDDVEVDPEAMKLNGYHDRLVEANRLSAVPKLYTNGFAASVMESWLSDVMVVCSPSFFDIGFLSAWFSRMGRDHPWKHRNVIDLKSYAAGKFGTVSPLKNEHIGQVLGVEDTLDHTALQDARWTAEVFRALCR